MTKQEIFSQTLKHLQNERFNRILEAKSYMQSAYKHKEILDLANKLGELKIELAKTDKSSIYDQMNLIKKELILKLNQFGYDINKIFPKFNCNICEDKGILEDGKICECLKKQYENNLLLNSKVKLDNFPTLNEISLDKYENENIKKIIKILSKISETKYNTFLFCGETGTGKTYVAKSFLKTYILQNNLGIFYDMSSLNQLFLNAHLDYENRDKLLSEINNCDCLIIDDLGSEPMYKNVTKEYLLTLLNERQNKNLITLFTTNLTLNDIKNIYNERFFSRLLDKNISLCCNFSGKDLRLSN